MSRRSLGLDAVRLIACVMVVLFHASVTSSRDKYFGEQPYGWLFEIEHIRMPLFFALSGFLMGTLYLNRVSGRGAAWDFITKRLKKIYPLYWLVLILMSSATLVMAQESPFEDGWVLLKTILLWPQDAREVGGTGAPVVYCAWVLQYEMLAYLLVTLALVSPLFLRAFVLVWPLAFVLFHDAGSLLLSFLGSKWLLIFWMGVVVARARSLASLQGWLPALVAALVFGAAMAARLSGWIGEEVEVILYGVAFASLMITLQPWTYAKVGTRVGDWIRKGADASYAIFLVHIAVVSMVAKAVLASGATGITGHALSLALSLVIAVALGVWVNRHVETRISALLSSSRQRENLPMSAQSS